MHQSRYSVCLMISSRTQRKTQGGNSANGIVIDECENKSYYVKTGASAKTRSAATVPDSTEIVLSYIKFHQDTVKGYAIASNDPRLNRVYTFIERGEFADTAKILPLKAAIESVPYVAEADIQSYYADSESEKDTTWVFLGNIVNTSWEQGAPYNNYAPYCSSKDKNMDIGCVPVAVSQLIAKCKRFKGTYMGNRNIDFDALTAIPQIYPINPLANQVATFLHEVAIYCKVKFDCDGTSTSLENAYQYLLDLGYSCYISDEALDPVLLYNNLKNGIPHIASGVDSDGNGHCWLVTGIRGYYVNSKNKFTSYMTYCNWGWGISDGWTALYSWGPYGKSYYLKNKQLYVTKY